eukprot:2426291-Rhodomonas_salina.1
MPHAETALLPRTSQRSPASADLQLCLSPATIAVSAKQSNLDGKGGGPLRLNSGSGEPTQNSHLEDCAPASQALAKCQGTSRARSSHRRTVCRCARGTGTAHRQN